MLFNWNLAERCWGVGYGERPSTGSVLRPGHPWETAGSGGVVVRSFPARCVHTYPPRKIDDNLLSFWGLVTGYKQHVFSPTGCDNSTSPKTHLGIIGSTVAVLIIVSYPFLAFTSTRTSIGSSGTIVEGVIGCAGETETESERAELR